MKAQYGLRELAQGSSDGIRQLKGGLYTAVGKSLYLHIYVVRVANKP